MTKTTNKQVREGLAEELTTRPRTGMRRGQQCRRVRRGEEEEPNVPGGETARAKVKVAKKLVCLKNLQQALLVE